MTSMTRRTVQAVLGVLALYAVGRGAAEFFVLDYAHPASYREDWGGPSLAGVLAVHAGPGLLALAWSAAWLVRRRGRRHLAG